MNLAWTRNLSDQTEIDRFTQSLQNSIVLDRLYDLLSEMKTEQERTEQGTDQYDNPNWEYRQADRNGYLRALNQIIKLTDPDQRKSKLIL